MEEIKIGDKVKYVGTNNLRKNDIGKITNIIPIKKDLYKIDIEFMEYPLSITSKSLNYKDADHCIKKYLDSKHTFFKDGDKVVYCGITKYLRGKLGVVKYRDNYRGTYPINVDFKKYNPDLGIISFTIDGREYSTDNTASIELYEENIFKVGDIVYDWRYGKGVVREVESLKLNYLIKVKFDKSLLSYTVNGHLSTSDNMPRLSFTPYDFVNGGFSQERPLPDIEKDTLIYVNIVDTWEMRYFSHWEHGKAYCFKSQRTSKETSSVHGWSEWSLTNPLEK